MLVAPAIAYRHNGGDANDEDGDVGDDAHRSEYTCTIAWLIGFLLDFAISKNSDTAKSIRSQAMHLLNQLYTKVHQHAGVQLPIVLTGLGCTSVVGGSIDFSSADAPWVMVWGTAWKMESDILHRQIGKPTVVEILWASSVLLGRPKLLSPLQFTSLQELSRSTFQWFCTACDTYARHLLSDGAVRPSILLRSQLHAQHKRRRLDPEVRRHLGATSDCSALLRSMAEENECVMGGGNKIARIALESCSRYMTKAQRCICNGS